VKAKQSDRVERITRVRGATSRQSGEIVRTESKSAELLKMKIKKKKASPRGRMKKEKTELIRAKSKVGEDGTYCGAQGECKDAATSGKGFGNWSEWLRVTAGFKG